MHNINDINHNVIKQLLYLACNYKLGTKNVNVKKINEERNVMCQMESMKRTLTMMPLALLVCLKLDINRCGWDSPFLGSF